MDIPLVPRAPWGNFPDVLIVAEVKAVKDHRTYEAAKTGDVAAAKVLAAAFVDENVLAALRHLLVGRNPVLAAVHAIEDRGINRIPAAFAELLAERLGVEVDSNVVQGNIVSHTGASGWERIARPPEFDGAVVAGQTYFMVDDFIGQGGTLANLRGFLVAAGGDVLGAITLTGKSYSAKLAPSSETLRLLREKHGQELEDWWRQTFGYALDCLTESEARYLFRAEDFDTIRTNLAEAGS